MGTTDEQDAKHRETVKASLNSLGARPDRPKRRREDREDEEAAGLVAVGGGGEVESRRSRAEKLPTALAAVPLATAAGAQTQHVMDELSKRREEKQAGTDDQEERDYRRAMYGAAALFLLLLVFAAGILTDPFGGSGTPDHMTEAAAPTTKPVADHKKPHKKRHHKKHKAKKRVYVAPAPAPAPVQAPVQVSNPPASSGGGVDDGSAEFLPEERG